MVACSRNIQLERLLYSAELQSAWATAEEIIDSQMSLEEKTSCADHVVWNNGARPGPGRASEESGRALGLVEMDESLTRTESAADPPSPGFGVAGTAASTPEEGIAALPPDLASPPPRPVDSGAADPPSEPPAITGTVHLGGPGSPHPATAAPPQPLDLNKAGTQNFRWKR